MSVVTLYSRPGCHLCDEMKAIIAQVLPSEQTLVTFSEVDISTDPELERKHGLEIPVLMVDGRKVAKYRIVEEQLRRVLNIA